MQEAIIEGCPICGSPNNRPGVDQYRTPDRVDCDCDRCGKYSISRNALVNLRTSSPSDRQKGNISGWLHENQGHLITAAELEKLLELPSPSFHERADKILLALERSSTYAGYIVNLADDFISAGWCANSDEFKEILHFLQEEQRISKEPQTTNTSCKLLPSGWAYIEDLKRKRIDMSQCFVAMWYADEMQEAYDLAIKPAIEFIEEPHSTPRFKAFKVNDKEHVNDINDEIIGEIRRSRFMVCDLTGYRGGVYFEAGLAYGLGLEVIYTCRKDWTADEILKDGAGNSVEELLDSEGKGIRVRKEGVHFDLAHRNRIEWTMEDLPDFKKRLEKRIKAVVRI